jgi:hypothetical protein
MIIAFRLFVIIITGVLASHQTHAKLPWSPTVKGILRNSSASVPRKKVRIFDNKNEKYSDISDVRTFYKSLPARKAAKNPGTADHIKGKIMGLIPERGPPKPSFSREKISGPIPQENMNNYDRAHRLDHLKRLNQKNQGYWKD